VREAISYVFDDFRLDVKRQELQKGGNLVPLTHKAYRVLLILVQNSEQTVEKEYIYRELWGDSFVEDANLTQHIYILRKTLGQNAAGDSYIETVSRTGYRFTVPVRAVYPPQIAEAFFKPKTGVEPALDPQPRPRVEPHLRLAELNPIDETASDDDDADVKQPEAAVEKAPPKKRIIIIAVLAALAIATIALIVYLRPTSSTTANAPIRSVAVLPFKPIGEESRNERLGLGMADAIITNLTKLRQIPVRPTSSVIRYIDLPQNNSVTAGSELGVDTVLEGSVQLANDRVRVSVQLIDVAGGKAIWAENFDEPFRDVFEVQDSISKKVVRSIAASLTQPDRQTGGGTTTSLEAMRAYQLGVYLHSTRTKENLFKAEEYFKEAVAKDPHFAKAYAMLADTYNMQRYYRFADPRDTRAKGLDAASRALELDSSTPEAYIAMANLQVGGKDGLAGSKRLLEKAIELSPFDATARLRYAWVISGEDLKAASEQMRLAQEYDPVSPITNGAYCNMLIFERRFKDAVPFCEKASDLNPTSNNSHAMLSDVYMFDGRVDVAIAKVTERIARLQGEERLVAEGSLALYLLKAGRRPQAESIIARLKVEAEKVPELFNDLTVLMFELGDREAGMKFFKSAYERRLLHLAMIEHYPTWEKVKADPEVQRILAEPPPSPPSPSPNPNR
jgi:TolB-like protein/DNA-binding winged helix-turn-helix (wHTH) protein/tetratricopeptide (TPR) repeat protein